MFGSYIQYADDLKFYMEIGKDGDSSCLQRSLSSLCEWALINKLTINPLKTVFVTFRGGRSATRTYSIDGLIIGPSASVKDLGIRFDSKL